jgi:DNA modification methylase
MPEKSVHCVVTSPPYWNLRRYDQVERFWTEVEAVAWAEEKSTEWNRDLSFDGNARHMPRPARWDNSQKKWVGAVATEVRWEDGWCSYGNEETVAGYVGHTVEIFCELRRVLRDDGVIWWNIADSYSSGGSLCLIPYRVALALQEDGWVVRADVPWPKRAAMPDSADSRPGRALEYVFMLTKSMEYFFDMEAVRKRAIYPGDDRGARTDSRRGTGCNSMSGGPNSTGRNWRNCDLWFEQVEAPFGMVGVGNELLGVDATAAGYQGSHFASFSFNLIRPLILSGTSERCCARCGSPWRRVVEVNRGAMPKRRGGKNYGQETGCDHSHNSALCREGGDAWYNYAGTSETVGWEPTCECSGKLQRRMKMVEVPVPLDYDPGGRDRSLSSNNNGSTGSLDGIERETTMEWREVDAYESEVSLSEHPVDKCVVLDPFAGTASTMLASYRLGRRSVGIDMSLQYLREDAVPRCREATSDRRHLAAPPRRRLG